MCVVVDHEVSGGGEEEGQELAGQQGGYFLFAAKSFRPEWESQPRIKHPFVSNI